MPHINIYVEDNTGAEYTGGESAVFIPGSFEIQDGYRDSNGCTYISTSQYNSLGSILKLDTLPSNAAAFQIGTLALIEACLSNNLDVVYCHVNGYSLDSPLPDSIEFLKDKDTYNVKFLTTGYFGIKVSKGEAQSATLQDKNTFKYTPDFQNLTKLITIAKFRKDCRVISGFHYYNSPTPDRDTKTGKAVCTLLDDLTDGDGLAYQISTTLNSADSNPVPDGEYGALLLPNLTSTLTLNSAASIGSTILTMPSIYGYLINYGKSLAKGQEWLPMANSERGSVSSIGVTDLTVTKYNLDTNIIKDTDGVSFNGIVNLRPYGDVIWGDRTLLKLTTTVKATAYLSLGLLVCDVAKRAYQAAVRYTYESNNDVTWFNFKTRVTSLLDEMVAAGVLSNYKMQKQPSKTYNTITCKITLYPNLPVENFEIYINLENADISTSGDEE